jgi:hypothetical protein
MTNAVPKFVNRDTQRLYGGTPERDRFRLDALDDAVTIAVAVRLDNADAGLAFPHPLRIGHGRFSVVVVETHSSGASDHCVSGISSSKSCVQLVANPRKRQLSSRQIFAKGV